MTNYTKWLDSLKVGDEVAFRTKGWSAKPIYDHGFSKIVKITPARRHILLEDGKKFDKYGDEITTQYSRRVLVRPELARQTMQEQKEEFAKKAKAQALSAVLTGLSLEQLEKVEEFIRELLLIEQG